MTITVNGEKITAADITREKERMQQYYYQYMQSNNAEGSDEELAKWAAENLVEQTLLKQESQKSIPPPTPDVLAAELAKVKDQLGDMSNEDAKKELSAHIMVEKLIQDITKDVPLPADEEILEFYNNNKELFKMPEQVHVSHIVKHVNGPADAIKANEEIQNIKQQLDEGVPFEELATSHSDCPDSAGDLGFFPRGQMVQEFEDIVFGLKPGEVSGVFATQFGYHIAKVHEKRPAGTASLHEVRDYIAKELTRIRSQKLLEEFVDELKVNAEIIREEND